MNVTQFKAIIADIENGRGPCSLIIIPRVGEIAVDVTWQWVDEANGVIKLLRDGGTIYTTVENIATVASGGPV